MSLKTSNGFNGSTPPRLAHRLAWQKKGGEETEQDIALSRKTLEFVQVLKPRHFTLENVWGYRKSKSWKLIFDGLRQAGYGVDFWHINAADYGVPQTRKRMIVIANRDGTRPQKPLATHRKKTESDNQLSMFEMLPNWISWYEVIEDLIPTLPDSQFAPWQIARLPEELKSFVFPSGGNTNFEEAHLGKGARFTDEPHHTVSTGDGGHLPKALLLPTQQELPMDERHPANTLCYGSRTGESYKAILLPVADGNSIMPDNGASQTITRTHLAGKYRAFIVGGGDQWKPVLQDDKSIFTVSATNMPKAFLVNGGNTVPIKDDTEPVIQKTGSVHKQKSRMAVQGRVVAMTVRCLARL